MLKFSGFADLTSCQGNGQEAEGTQKRVQALKAASQRTMSANAFCQLLTTDGQMHFMHQGQKAPWCTDTSHQHSELHNRWLGNPSAA